MRVKYKDLKQAVDYIDKLNSMDVTDLELIELCGVEPTLKDKEGMQQTGFSTFNILTSNILDYFGYNNKIQNQ